MCVFRGADPEALDRLSATVGRAAGELAELRQGMPPDVVAGIAQVEGWLRRQEADLRRRGQALAGEAFLGAGRGVLVIGQRVEWGMFVAGDLIIEAGQDAARGAGPFGPMIDDGATLAAHAVEGVGTAVRRAAEAESKLLIAVGRRLRG